MDVHQLESIPLFANLSRQERKALARRADEVEVAAGKRLVAEGRFGYEFFVIEEGRAEVTRGDDHVADLGPGDFFGEMALLNESQRNASVVASTPLTAMVMTAGEFRGLQRDLPAVAEVIRAACRKRSAALA
jgi:CRP-like cAMP-binding protein